MVGSVVGEARALFVEPLATEVTFEGVTSLIVGAGADWTGPIGA